MYYFRKSFGKGRRDFNELSKVWKSLSPATHRHQSKRIRKESLQCNGNTKNYVHSTLSSMLFESAFISVKLNQNLLKWIAICEAVNFAETLERNETRGCRVLWEWQGLELFQGQTKMTMLHIKWLLAGKRVSQRPELIMQ